LAYHHLEESLTKGNLWFYILAVLEEGEASPNSIKAAVTRRYGFSPATITFYSVLYRLRREGLVRRSAETFRTDYVITERGSGELARARALLERVRNGMGD